MSAEIHRAINAVWRIESAKIIAALARMVRDVGLAEELESVEDGAVVAHTRALSLHVGEVFVVRVLRDDRDEQHDPSPGARGEAPR